MLYINIPFNILLEKTFHAASADVRCVPLNVQSVSHAQNYRMSCVSDCMHLNP